MDTLMLAAISGGAILSVIITLIVVGLIYYVADWGLTKIAPPEPLNKLLRVLLILAVVIFVVNALLGLTGNSFIRFG